MRKNLLLMFALLIMGGVNVYATKTYATYGTPADQGKWDAETGVYTWTQGYSNLMTIFEFPNGELANYTSLHLTTSDYTDTYRVCFMNGSTAVATIAFYSAGQKDLTFSERNETKDLDLSKITHISFGGASGSGSITLTSTPYLESPVAIEFDEKGVAMIGLTDISYDSNLTFDDQTGVMTSNGQGTFSVALNEEDFTSVTKVELLHSGDDIVQTLQITDATNGVLNTWWSSKYSVNFTDFQSKAGSITKLSWNCSDAGTMTITGIRITSDVIVATNPAETPLTAAMFNNAYCEYHVGEAMEEGSTIYGNGSVLADYYADLSAYDELRIYGTPGKSIRLLFNWNSDDQMEISGNDVKLNSDGYYSLDLSTLPAHRLNAFKFPYDRTSGTINKIILYKKNVSVSYDYVLSGSGAMAPSVTAALADPNAKIYDATGVTGTNLDLTPANPNALFVANAGALANESNVIVDNTCANLVLTDGYPFKAPADFTATNATYSTTISTVAQAGTLCLPFDATIPSGVTAYKLDYTSGDAANAEAVEGTISANTPVLLNGSGSVTFTGSGAVVADAGNVYEAMTGVFEATTAPTGSYVLQNGDKGVGFYKVIEADPITVNPFRAYLTAQGAGAALRIVYQGDTTGIDAVESAADSREDAFYTLSGVRVSQPVKGFYIKNGKKVLVK